MIIYLRVKKDFKKVIFLTGLPVILCVYFYFTKYGGSIVYNLSHPIQYFLDIFPIEFIFLFLIVLLVYLKNKIYKVGQNFQVSYFKGLISYWLYWVAIVVFIVLIHAVRDPKGYELGVRLFVQLTPINIILTTAFSIELIKMFKKDFFGRLNASLLLACIFLPKFILMGIKLYAWKKYFI